MIAQYNIAICDICGNIGVMANAGEIPEGWTIHHYDTCPLRCVECSTLKDEDLELNKRDRYRHSPERLINNAYAMMHELWDAKEELYCALHGDTKYAESEIREIEELYSRVSGIPTASCLNKERK